MEDKDGVWRTIRGRRIFIRSGESLGSAMSRSGKFKGISRQDLKDNVMTKSIVDRLNKRKQSKIGLPLNNKKNEKIDRKNLQHLANKGYINEKYYNPDNQHTKNQIYEQGHINKNATTRVERNRNKYSYADVQELKHEELQKKLADYRNKKGIRTSITSEEYNKRMNDALKQYKEGKIDYKEYDDKTNDLLNNYQTPRMNKLQTKLADKKAIADYKAKKQSNNKIDSERYIDNKDYDITTRNLGNASNIARDMGDYKNAEILKRASDISKEQNDLLKKQSNNKIEKSSNNYDSKTLEEAKAELGWGHHNLTNEKAVEEKFGKQSNNKIETERELYERAKNNPDSIDPMTENSTDWESLENKYGNKESQDIPYERDLQDVVKSLNDEGSDFSWSINEYKDGKASLNVGVFMPDERGYVDRDVEFDLKGIKGNTAEGYSQIEDKIREWQDKHNSPDSFYDNDFEDKEKVQKTIKAFKEKKQSNNKINTNIVDYDKMEDYDVYNEGMKFLEDKNRPTNAHYEVDKIMRRIDNANKRGEGFSNKATNDLRKYLKENGNLVKSKEEIKKERELYKSIFGKYPPKK